MPPCANLFSAVFSLLEPLCAGPHRSCIIFLMLHFIFSAFEIQNFTRYFSKSQTSKNMDVEEKSNWLRNKLFFDFGKNLNPLFGRFVLANKKIREEEIVIGY